MTPEVAALVAGLLIRQRKIFSCVPFIAVLGAGDKLCRITGLFETPYILEKAYDKALEFFDQNKFNITGPIF